MESVLSRTNKIKSFIYIPHEPQPNLICKHNIYIIMPLGNFHFIYLIPFCGCFQYSHVSDTRHLKTKIEWWTE
jgi:hypothetical protein